MAIRKVINTLSSSGPDHATTGGMPPAPTPFREGLASFVPDSSRSGYICFSAVTLNYYPLRCRPSGFCIHYFRSCSSSFVKFLDPTMPHRVACHRHPYHFLAGLFTRGSH